MRILFVSRSLPSHRIGGMENVLWSLARALRDRGHDIEVLTTACATLPSTTIREGIAIRTLDVPSGRYSRAWWTRSVQVYAAEYRSRVDLVLGVGRATNAIARHSAKSGPPIALQVHNTMWSLFVFNLSEFRPRSLAKAIMDVRDLVEDRALRRHDQLIAIGPAVEARMKRAPMAWLAGDVPLALIPNGIDDTLFAFDAAARHAVRAQLRVADDAPVVISVGRLHANKGIGQALEGFARALRTRLDMRFVIVGDGAAQAELQAQTVRLGIENATRFAGPATQQQVAAWLSAADVLLFTATGPEGLPTVMLEAAAAGLPVVLSDKVAIPEIASIRVDPHDPEDVARGIAEAVAQPHSGRASTLPRRYTLDEWAGAYERLFEQLVAARRGAEDPPRFGGVSRA